MATEVRSYSSVMSLSYISSWLEQNSYKNSLARKRKVEVSESDIICPNLKDHNYSVKSKDIKPNFEKKEVSDHSYQVVNGEYEKSLTSISSTKDLQKQTEIEERRFKVKIQESNGSYFCRCCQEHFSTEIFARIHIRKEKCKSKKKKKEEKSVSCQEEGCGCLFTNREAISILLYT